MPTVTLRQSDIDKCYTFCTEFMGKAKRYEFGNPNSAHRGYAETLRDAMIGKLGEVGVARFFSMGLGMPILNQLDWNVYKQGQEDDADLVLAGMKFEIKTSRSGSRFILYELGKLNARRDRLPDWLIFAIAGWDRKSDVPTGKIDIVGHLPAYKLFTLEDNGWVDCTDDGWTFKIHGGEVLPDTNSIMITTNCGRHKDLLDSDFTSLFRRIKKGMEEY